MRKLFIDVIRYLLIFLFVYAAVSKLGTYHKFEIQLGQSPLLPRWFANIGWSIPVVELIVALLLITPRWLRVALYLSFTLMLAFTLYIAGILTVASRVPCSCGGVLDSLSWGEHLIVNCCFLLLSILAIVLYERKESEPLKSDVLSH